MTLISTTWEQSKAYYLSFAEEFKIAEIKLFFEIEKIEKISDLLTLISSY